MSLLIVEPNKHKQIRADSNMWRTTISNAHTSMYPAHRSLVPSAHRWAIRAVAVPVSQSFGICSRTTLTPSHSRLNYQTDSLKNSFIPSHHALTVRSSSPHLLAYLRKSVLPSSVSVQSSRSLHTDFGQEADDRGIIIAPVDPLVWPVFRYRFAFLFSEISLFMGSVSIGALGTGYVFGSLFASLSSDPLDRFMITSHVGMVGGALAYWVLSVVLARRFRAFAIPAANLKQITTRTPLQHAGRIVGAYAVVLAVGFSCMLLVSTVSEDEVAEDPILIEVGLDFNNSLALLTIPSLLGPASEELIFRFLLFARLVRAVGLWSAYAASSAAFGLAHYSDDSNKVLATGAMGGLVSWFYHYTQSFIATIALHAAVNTAQLRYSGHLNPMSSYDSLCAAEPELLAPWRLEALDQIELVEVWLKKFWIPIKRQMQSVTSKLSSSSASSTTTQTSTSSPASQMSLLTPDLNDLSAEVKSLSSTLFDCLDANSKGYLSLSEWSWLYSMQTDEFVHLRAVCNIVARRTHGWSEADRLELVQQRQFHPHVDVDTLLKAHMTQLQNHGSIEYLVALPQSKIAASKDQIARVVERANSLMPMVSELTRPALMHELHPQSPNLRYAADFTQLTDPLQQLMVIQWWTIRQRIEYQRLWYSDAIITNNRVVRTNVDHSSVDFRACTKQALQKYLLTNFILHPHETIMWLNRAVLVLNQKMPHPAEALWKHRTTSANTNSSKSEGSAKSD